MPAPQHAPRGKASGGKGIGFVSCMDKILSLSPPNLSQIHCLVAELLVALEPQHVQLGQAAKLAYVVELVVLKVERFQRKGCQIRRRSQQIVRSVQQLQVLEARQTRQSRKFVVLQKHVRNGISLLVAQSCKTVDQYRSKAPSRESQQQEKQEKKKRNAKMTYP